MDAYSPWPSPNYGHPPAAGTGAGEPSLLLFFRFRSRLLFLLRRRDVEPEETVEGGTHGFCKLRRIHGEKSDNNELKILVISSDIKYDNNELIMVIY